MRIFFRAWTMVLLSLAGCIPLLGDDNRLNPANPMPRPLAAPPLTEDQVNRENAYPVSTALWDEMDQEEQNDSPPAAPASPTAKKK